MTKTIIGLALAGVMLVAGAMWQAADHAQPLFATSESAEREQGRSPSEGDYWAVHYGYAGDAKHLRFEPAWLIDAAAQESKIASAIPAGAKTYRAAANAPMAL